MHDVVFLKTLYVYCRYFLGLYTQWIKMEPYYWGTAVRPWVNRMGFFWAYFIIKSTKNYVITFFILHFNF